ncbi:4,5-DOPA dioxygenase extradiol [Peptoniphilus sp. MSJ-1]|uniref:4,5-DOPA dioxygenase extradiol n=2 Tax=Peptoniphilus ovalis TaxID=2841503 RepID=A0ABS6FEQ0_9FIRM|nr:4,5-DOPA dioxygenase extradiol [Peptoniphilus ovalis]
MKMPTIFIGHGSPMNAIENNVYTEKWKEIGEKIEKPKAILSISAHWFTKGSFTTNEANPRTVYDMYGFPKELYDIVYDAPGAPELADEISKKLNIDIDNSWGIDHGTWSVLHHMYPNRDIPVFQISIDATKDARYHYELGEKLKYLRDEKVLILGSGNVVHNLRLVDYNKKGGFDFAIEFDRKIKEDILNKNHENIINYKNYGEIADLSVPYMDHFAPLLYVLGASNKDASVLCEGFELGSLSMTSYIFD